MRSNPAHGTWEDVFAACPIEVTGIATELRSVILQIHPEAVIVSRPGDRAVNFGHGEKKMSEAYAYLMPQKDRVNLGFYWGAILPDPLGLLEGTGANLRHVKVRTIASAKSPEVMKLIQEAIAERKAALRRG
jgi:hypothetical protein